MAGDTVSAMLRMTMYLLPLSVIHCGAGGRNCAITFRISSANMALRSAVVQAIPEARSRLSRGRIFLSVLSMV